MERGIKTQSGFKAAWNCVPEKGGGEKHLSQKEGILREGGNVIQPKGQNRRAPQVGPSGKGGERSASERRNQRLRRGGPAAIGESISQNERKAER